MVLKLKDVINKIFIPQKISFGQKGFKYFIGYKDDDKVKSLSIMSPKINEYAKSFYETKYMSFL